MTSKTFLPLLTETFSSWLEDKAPRLGAALAYYSIFSLAPLLIIAIAITGMVFGEAAARGQVVEQIEETVGKSTAEAVAQMIQHAADPQASRLATILGVVMLVLGASGVFGQLQDALNTIWKVKRRPGQGIKNFVWDRLVSFIMVLGISILLLVSLVLTALIDALGKFLAPAGLAEAARLWQGVNGIVSFLVTTLLFGMIFKVLPDVKLTWRDVAVGALVTALLFTLGKYLIALYLARASLASAYGAAGSIVAILVWVYYSSQIVLLGAEFTRVTAMRFGKQIEAAANAMLVTNEERDRQGMD